MEAEAPSKTKILTMIFTKGTVNRVIVFTHPPILSPWFSSLYLSDLYPRLNPLYKKNLHSYLSKHITLIYQKHQDTIKAILYNKWFSKLGKVDECK